MRGYCAIGTWQGKNEYNLGTLWRSAYLLGANFIFTIGRRYRKQASDTVKAWKTLPLFTFDSIDDLTKHTPFACPLIGIELDAKSIPIQSFKHPERAVYLLGAEDHGLSEEARSKCHALIQLPGEMSMNVAAAGTVVLYDRIAKYEMSHPNYHFQAPTLKKNNRLGTVENLSNPNKGQMQ